MKRIYLKANHLKANYLKTVLAGTVAAVLLAGCGGGGGSSGNTTPADLTYRNLALKATVKSSVDESLSNVKVVNDGISNLNNAYWTGFKKDDQFVMVFNDFKEIKKLVIHTNDIRINATNPTKIISLAKGVNSNNSIEWIDVFFDKPTVEPTTTTTVNGQPVITKAEYLVCSSHKEENNTITCNFDKPLYVLFAQLRLADSNPSVQHIYEFEVWGNDAPR